MGQAASAFFIAVAGPVFAPAEQPAPVADVIRDARKAVVEVLVDGQLKGGGAFVSEDGLVITAAHLFSRPDAVFRVITASDQRLRAELVAFDKGHDVALLRVSGAEGEAHPALKIARNIPPAGSRVFNFGMALRNRGLVLDGTVAQQETVFNELAESNGYIENFFVSAMTPSLTSGGVWINRHGEIAGVQSGRLNDGTLTSGIAMVSPPQAIANLVRTQRTAATPDIGGWVWEVWTTDKAFLESIPEDTEGLVITWMRKDGPLDQAGLKRLDTILACDGEPVRRRVEFVRMIRGMKPGEKVTLTILEQHADETSKIDVTLESLEAFWVEEAEGRK